MLDDLLFTLDVARKSLPANADPVHYERLDTIAGIVRQALSSQGMAFQAASTQKMITYTVSQATEAQPARPVTIRVVTNGEGSTDES